MDKSTLIQSLQTGRIQWEALLAQIPEERMLEPGAEGTWSVKDTLAHVLWSEREVMEAFRARDFTGGSELWNLPLNERNQRVVEEQRGRPLQEIRDEERRVYLQLFEVVQTLDEEDLTDPRRFRGMPESWVPWQIIAGSTFQHYPEHMASLRAWLQRDQ
jgi:uncharacterized damage-inducible protein DinB